MMARIADPEADDVEAGRERLREAPVDAERDRVEARVQDVPGVGLKIGAGGQVMPGNRLIPKTCHIALGS